MVHKKHLSLKPFLFTGLLLTLFALGVSCSKDTKCKMEVSVVDADNKPVANALTKVSAGPAPYEVSTYKAEGNTNGQGIFSCEFDYPAVCKATAEKDGLTGLNSVSTKEGETVKVTIVLHQQITEPEEDPDDGWDW